MEICCFLSKDKSLLRVWWWYV